MKTKTKAKITYGIIAFVLIFALLQIYTSVNPIGYAKTFGQRISNVVYDVSAFDPFTGLDLTGSTPAPAILCTLTNNVHIIGTDGSDYSLNTSTDYFQPTFNVVNPYNNAPVDHVLVRVYLYCKSSTLTSYGYYPYLTGGSVGITFLSRDVTGQNQIAYSSSQNVITGEPNGASMLIAEFNEPVSKINDIANKAGVDYVSQQTVTTSGTLQFKQKLQSAQPTATYSIVPFSTYFGYLIQSPTGSILGGQLNTQQYINVISPNQQTNYQLDKSKSTGIVIQVGVNGYRAVSGLFGQKESAPIVSIYKVVSGVTDSTHPIADYTLPDNPNQADNGNYKVWTYPIDVKSLSTGTYEIGLHGQTLSTGQSRPWTHATFQIIDNTVSGGGSGAGNIGNQSGSSQYCTVQQIENLYYFDGKSCVKIGAGLPSINDLQNQLATSLNSLNTAGPTVGIILIGVIIVIILGHFAHKKAGGSGYLYNPNQLS